MNQPARPASIIRWQFLSTYYALEIPVDVTGVAPGYYPFTVGWTADLDKDACPQLYAVVSSIERLYTSGSGAPGPIRFLGVELGKSGVTRLRLVIDPEVDLLEAIQTIVEIVRNQFGLGECEFVLGNSDDITPTGPSLVPSITDGMLTDRPTIMEMIRPVVKELELYDPDAPAEGPGAGVRPPILIVTFHLPAMDAVTAATSVNEALNQVTPDDVLSDDVIDFVGDKIGDLTVGKVLMMPLDDLIRRISDPLMPSGDTPQTVASRLLVTLHRSIAREEIV